MCRSLRLLGASLVTLLGLTALGAGSVAAAAVEPAVTASSVSALHGFGASAPTERKVPPTGGSPAFRTALALGIPATVDLRRFALTPGNQGQVNSCVPWAIDYALLGWYSRSTGRVGQPFAPMYTYSQINGGGDYGSEPAAALDIAVRQGTDTRAHYTKSATNWSSLPSAAERANAAKYKIKGYTTLFVGASQTGTVNALKAALAANTPVAIKLAVRNGFEYIASTSTAVDNDTSTAILGYHEVLAVGYDAAGLIVQNSWGTGWANGGFGRISWRVVQNDVWEGETISGFTPVPTAPFVTVPTLAFRAASATTSPTTRVTVTWTGRAGTTGAVTRYDAWYQVDGSARIAVKLAAPKSTSLTLTVRKGHRYRVSVRATAGTTVGKIYFGAWFAV